ncbi:unnamed protein product [Allacma fusca]|uniref:Uncharacterized protein n=1 Tax=Allacma fusca TaxID=39272 RepID=A0A8J2KGS9_9HEXA|nr:unnamed protein product [Allacma fusca]
MAWQQQPNYGGFGNQGFPGGGGPFPGGYPGGGYPSGYPQQPPPAGYYNPQQPGGYPQMPNMGFHMPPDVEQGQGFPKNEDSDFQGFEFSDKTIRQGFIRKVYSILMVQLLVTFGFVTLFVYNEDMKLWTRANPGFFIGALVLTVVLLLAMACCESARRKSPMNFICLGLFTVAEGFVLGAASSSYDEKSVLLAVGLTTVICLSLTIFSFQTKFDMTAKGGILFILLIVLMLFGFLAIFLRS